MRNKTSTQYSRHSPKHNYQKFKQQPLSHTIQALITFGGLAITSSGALATEALFNPNEIWLHRGRLHKICVKDIDQDNDLDILKVFGTSITLLENKGSAVSPDFSLSTSYISNLSDLKLKQLELKKCFSYPNGNDIRQLVDIDADGDLDLFESSFVKGLVSRLRFSRNEGTDKNPDYIPEESIPFNLPSSFFSSNEFIFSDFDNDGDQDFWHSIESDSIFYENSGTPENADFTLRENQSTSICGLLVDLNNDGQLDMLCRDSDNNLSYFESKNGAFLTEKKLFNPGYYEDISSLQALDMNNDGNIDIVGRAVPFSSSTSDQQNLIVYYNLGFDVNSVPHFDQGQIFTSLPSNFSSSNATFLTDLNDDDHLDLVFTQFGKIKHYINIGSNTNPLYNTIDPIYNSTDSNSIFKQCNNSLHDFFPTDEILNPSFDFVDIDGDNDLDLFVTIKTSFFTSEKKNTTAIIYCENISTSTSKHPKFTSGILNPFGLNSLNQVPYTFHLSFIDVDNDGDQDFITDKSIFFENIGHSNNPLFRKTSFIALPHFFRSSLNIERGVDLNGDGHIETLVITNNAHHNLRLLYKGLEPVTKIAATAIKDSNFHSFTPNLAIATIRDSQVQLQQYSLSNFLLGSKNFILLPDIAKEISLTTGHFDADNQEDILLALVDNNDHLQIKIYNQSLKLIASGTGGIASSLSVSAGQLDNDPEDEGVVSFIQDDGRAVAVSFNVEGTLLGAAIANQAKQTSIAVGQFENNAKGFVLAYLTPDNQIETTTFKADATLIGQGSGGEATYVSVSSANILGSSLDEYIISLTQPDGISGLIGFDSKANWLGKVTGNITQPTTLSGNFFRSSSPTDPVFGQTGLAVSSILPDGRPAISFLNNQGQHIATGTGEPTASQATIAVMDINGDGGDEGVLIYIDNTGLPRWEIFSADGKRIQQ